jgi:uncharacterized protein
VLSKAETVVQFQCGDDELMGIIHPASVATDTAVVFVVGGPQYRVGSHRMFVDLARALAGVGLPVLRFDCRGMGDSDGKFDSFEHLSEDIRAAVDAAVVNLGVRQVVLVGLCDGASACALYAAGDTRVAATVLMNPWVRSQVGEAKARITHYYGSHVRELEFWRRLFTGKVNLLGSLKAFASNLRLSFLRGAPETEANYVERMLKGLAAFRNSVLVLLSANDLTAQEFMGLVDDSPEWNRVVKRSNTTISIIEGADHTFSGANEIDDVARRIVHFCASLS